MRLFGLCTILNAITVMHSSREYLENQLCSDTGVKALNIILLFLNNPNFILLYNINVYFIHLIIHNAYMIVFHLGENICKHEK